MKKVIDTLKLEQIVGSGDCDFTKTLTLGSLTRGMQESAYLHAKSLKLDAENICEGEYHWVLTRLSIQIDTALPRWNDNWSINTWITGQDKLFAYREFEFFAAGQHFGRGSSTWLLIDAHSRRPAPPEKAFSCIDIEFPPEEQRADARRLRSAPIYTQSLNNRITYNHIDLNNHVNNTKYFGFFMQHFPREFFETHRVKEFHINFSAELQWGDEAAIEMESSQEGDAGSVAFHHRILNQGGKVSALGESLWGNV
jgi:medium-chain acyl-[acyl-carrier-protein] hydrolase